MARPRNTPDLEDRPQDDPDYQDAGQLGAAEVNEQQAKLEEQAAKEADG